MIAIEYLCDPNSPVIDWNMLERNDTLKLIDFGPSAIGNVTWFQSFKPDGKTNVSDLIDEYKSNPDVLHWFSVCKYPELADLLIMGLTNDPKRVLKYRDDIVKYHYKSNAVMDALNEAAVLDMILK